MLSVRLVTQTELSASKTKPVASPRVVQGEQRKNLFQLLTTVAKKKMPSLKLLCSAYCFLGWMIFTHSKEEKRRRTFEHHDT